MAGDHHEASAASTRSVSGLRPAQRPTIPPSRQSVAPPSRGQRRKGDVIVGTSRAIREVHRLIELAAPREIDVLVTGESGTGKELVARTLHAQSRRTSGPFVVVDCSAIPPDLLENELFGHARGAYTGAQGPQVGLVEAARGGTLFLDEIGELPLAAQAKLLRLLQEREYRPLGSAKAMRADVRMIFATNRDLQASVRAGEFRRDLFYRLAGLTIDLPPLRARTEDVPLLVEHFLRALREPLAHEVERFSAAAMSALAERRWPGNVRELYNCTRTTIVLTHAAVIEPEHLWFPPEPEGSGPDALELGYAALRRRALARFEEEFVAAVLGAAGGNISLAARLGKIDRKHLWRLMRRARVSSRRA